MRIAAWGDRCVPRGLYTTYLLASCRLLKVLLLRQAAGSQ